ncbi:hypothetical protein [Algoriphagus sp. CAU 1675]|uniref:hypothetical protein n=1 Tax=Algoriphagus sp. CAU 1675 TaxID=3032597 RepID=UPI0023DCCFE4|nr:hypothetical protein [Algoriphagus sp. CAU 1675]MDF2157818.1 hypothetical protein [Algoriphagus sp. CAU 1675]
MKSCILLFFVLLVVSCQSDEEGVSKVGAKAIFTSIDSPIQNSANLKNSLEQLVPLSLDSIRKLVPVKIGDYKAEKIVAGSRFSGEVIGLEIRFINEHDPEKKLTLELIDGAGKTGFLILNASKERLKNDFEELFLTGYRRVYSKDGLRVREELDHIELDLELEFILKNRFQYKIKSKKLAINELWDLVQVLI